jgi:hypothetical protein
VKCDKCKQPCLFGLDYYMVWDDVWLVEACMKDRGFLCLTCLSSRLGRPLREDDFMDCMVNDVINTWFVRVQPLALDRLLPVDVLAEVLPVMQGALDWYEQRGVLERKSV